MSNPTCCTPTSGDARATSSMLSPARPAVPATLLTVTAALVALLGSGTAGARAQDATPPSSRTLRFQDWRRHSILRTTVGWRAARDRARFEGLG